MNIEVTLTIKEQKRLKVLTDVEAGRMTGQEELTGLIYPCATCVV